MIIARALYLGSPLEFFSEKFYGSARALSLKKLHFSEVFCLSDILNLARTYFEKNS